MAPAALYGVAHINNNISRTEMEHSSCLWFALSVGSLDHEQLYQECYDGQTSEVDIRVLQIRRTKLFVLDM
jgi:hypothetical protein